MFWFAAVLTVETTSPGFAVPDASTASLVFPEDGGLKGAGPDDVPARSQGFGGGVFPAAAQFHSSATDPLPDPSKADYDELTNITLSILIKARNHMKRQTCKCNVNQPTVYLKLFFPIVAVIESSIQLVSINVNFIKCIMIKQNTN